MKSLALLLALVALTWCSLTTKPSESIINSWSIDSLSIASWAVSSDQISTWGISTWVDLLSWEDLTLSWSTTTIVQWLSGDIKDWVAFIQNYNIRVNSWSQLIQLTKNGWRTGICKNWQPLEYLDPQLNWDYLLLIARCKDESSSIYVRDIKQWWSYLVSEWNIAKRYNEGVLQINNRMFCANLLATLKNKISYTCQDIPSTTKQKFEQQLKSFLTKSYFPNITSCSNGYDNYIKNNISDWILWYNILWYTKKGTIIFTIIRRYSEWIFSESPLYLKNWVIGNAWVWINELNNLCVKWNQMWWVIMEKDWNVAKAWIFDFEQEKIIQEYTPPTWRTISYPSFYGDDFIDIVNSGNKVIIKHYDQKLIEVYSKNANDPNNRLPAAQTVMLPLK